MKFNRKMVGVSMLVASSALMFACSAAPDVERETDSEESTNGVWEGTPNAASGVDTSIDINVRYSGQSCGPSYNYQHCAGDLMCVKCITSATYKCMNPKCKGGHQWTG